MKEPNPLWRLFVLAAGAALPCMAALAADPAPPSTAPEAGETTMAHGHRIDWIEHTRQTLDELKAKLNLTPAQAQAWETWSAGAMKDAHAQYEQRKTWLEERNEKEAQDGTTPQRMARGIERLRAETNWMEQHLTQLEGAQVRTQVFYDALDTNQKTIFDLFWREVFHRAGERDGLGMHGHGAFGGMGHCAPER